MTPTAPMDDGEIAERLELLRELLVIAHDPEQGRGVREEALKAAEILAGSEDPEFRHTNSFFNHTMRGVGVLERAEQVKLRAKESSSGSQAEPPSLFASDFPSEEDWVGPAFMRVREAVEGLAVAAGEVGGDDLESLQTRERVAHRAAEDATKAAEEATKQRQREWEIENARRIWAGITANDPAQVRAFVAREFEVSINDKQAALIARFFSDSVSPNVRSIEIERGWRGVVRVHTVGTGKASRVTFEVDRKGRGQWIWSELDGEWTKFV